MGRQFGRATIELVQGNIVTQAVDAIVNAANTSLLGGGGVDGAIHRAAGPSVLEECRALPVDDQGRRCLTGEVQVTGAGDLPAQYVIHAVGPFYNPGAAEKAEEQLRGAYVSALEAAVERACTSIAFPAISTGAYRFPLRSAAWIAIRATATFLRSEPRGLELVRFVLFDGTSRGAFMSALDGVDAP